MMDHPLLKVVEQKLGESWKDAGRIYSMFRKNKTYSNRSIFVSNRLLVILILVALATPINGAANTASHWEAANHYNSFVPMEGSQSEAFVPEGVLQNNSGTIAYVNNAHAQGEIWLIEPDGSTNRRLWSPGPVGDEGRATITGLSWRPDSGSLAFASSHEWLCSWYNSDIYTIAPDGSQLRRVTNAPNCSALAGYPKGTVTAIIENGTFSSGMIGVYIQGASQVQVVPISPFSSIQVTFNDVADLGDVVQPVVAIYGGYRHFGTAYANVQPGQTVDAGVLIVSGSGLWREGAYKASWRYDGSRIGYTNTNCTPMYHISPQPIDGTIGDLVLNTDDLISCVMDWGPTPARANQVLYSVVDVWNDDLDGIYLATVGSNSPGERLVSLPDFEGQTINDVKWLPDGSGFIFTKKHVDFGIMSDIFEYSFATGTETRITQFEDDEYALNFSISPDGQHIVFDLAREFEGPTDLYIIQRNGTNMRLLAQNAGHPAWSSGELLVPVFTNLYIPIVLR
jgi:hypothetical protein